MVFHSNIHVVKFFEGRNILRENALIPIKLWVGESKYLGWGGSKFCVSLEFFEGKFANSHRAYGGGPQHRDSEHFVKFRLVPLEL